jgi:hypothetical protein
MNLLRYSDAQITAVRTETVAGIPASVTAARHGLKKFEVYELRQALGVPSPIGRRGLKPPHVKSHPHTDDWFVECDQAFREAMRKAMLTEPREWPRDVECRT